MNDPINTRELLVRDILTEQGHSVEKMGTNKPDFLVDDSFFVEVKNGDSYAKGKCNLSDNQEIKFRNIKKPIKVYYVFLKKKRIIIEDYTPNYALTKPERILPQITYGEKDFEPIRKLKEKLGSNWHDFILDLVRYYNLKGGMKK